MKSYNDFGHAWLVKGGPRNIYSTCRPLPKDKEKNAANQEGRN